jgi:hypothetical protein
MPHPTKQVTFRAPANNAGFQFYHTSTGKPLPEGPLKRFYEEVLGPIHKGVSARNLERLRQGKIRKPKYPTSDDTVPTCIHDEVKAHAEAELAEGKIIKFRY